MTDDTKALLKLTKQAINTAKQATEELKRTSEALQSRIDKTKQYIQDVQSHKDITGE